MDVPQKFVTMEEVPIGAGDPPPGPPPPDKALEDRSPRSARTRATSITTASGGYLALASSAASATADASFVEHLEI